jgi:hypothetical protein
MSRSAALRILAWSLLVWSPALLSTMVGRPSPVWAAVGGGSVLAGLGAIRLTRGRWLSAPFLMLLLSVSGMAAGLLIDRHLVGAETLSALCLTAPRSFLANLLRHWDILRATHLAMLLGGLATVAVVEMRQRRMTTVRCRKAVCGRVGFNLMCNAAMLGGMLLGSWLGPAMAARFAWAWGMPSMISMMVAGMVWGMVGSMTLYRLAYALHDVRPAAHPARGPI